MGWLQARERMVFLATAGFQLLVLVGMIAGQAVPHATGRTVLLPVAPVDPRDLFRGDYVILSYPFSRIPAGGIEGVPGPLSSSDRQYWQGQTVYVTLVPEPDGLHFRGGSCSLTPPGPGVTFIAGTLEGLWRITFGIESYFVQEGKGKQYEEAIRDRRLWAEVALTPTGRAALKGLRIE